MRLIGFPERNKTKDLETLKEGAKQARLPFDQDMLLNIAFFLDHQYTEWVPDANMLRTAPRSPDEPNAPRPVTNKIMHFVMQEHAFALANRPTPDVLPASEDPTEISNAAVALAYLRWMSDPQVADFESELSDAAFWALLAGEGFLKWPFNGKEKRPDAVSVSPLDVYFDPYCRRFRNARWIIHETFMDVDEIYDTYGVKVRPGTPDATKTALLRQMGQAPVLDGAVVNELWLKPTGTGKYKDGLFAVWSGKDLLVAPTRFPYDHGQLPFTQLGAIPIPGSPHFTSAVKYLRSPQMELNKYHAQKLMSRQAFASPKWWVPTELELEADPNDSPRQILRGSGMSGLKPEILQGDVMRDPGDGDWIKSEMQDVVGLHEVSQAGVPGRVEAAKAIEMLKESDLSRLYVLENSIKVSIAQGFWQALMLAKQFVPEIQMVQTYSPEGYPEVREFHASKLSPAMRIKVTMGSGLTSSRAARSEAAMLLWQNQVIKDPEIFADIIEVPVETISPQRAFDMRLARNENLVIAAGSDGTAVTPNSWDEHQIHIREHNNYRKTAEYQTKSNEIKKKFEFHVQMHEELLIKHLEKEAKKALVAQGATLQPPGNGAPQPAQPGAATEAEDAEPAPAT